MSSNADPRLVVGPNRRQRRGIAWTAVALGLVAAAIFVTFILVTAAHS